MELGLFYEGTERRKGVTKWGYVVDFDRFMDLELYTLRFWVRGGGCKIRRYEKQGETPIAIQHAPPEETSQSLEVQS